MLQNWTFNVISHSYRLKGILKRKRYCSFFSIISLLLRKQTTFFRFILAWTVSKKLKIWHPEFRKIWLDLKKCKFLSKTLIEQGVPFPARIFSTSWAMCDLCSKFLCIWKFPTKIKLLEEFESVWKAWKGTLYSLFWQGSTFFRRNSRFLETLFQPLTVKTRWK